jgi:hypothetical protein
MISKSMMPRNCKSVFKGILCPLPWYNIIMNKTNIKDKIISPWLARIMI